MHSPVRSRRAAVCLLTAAKRRRVPTGARILKVTGAAENVVRRDAENAINAGDEDVVRGCTKRLHQARRRLVTHPEAGRPHPCEVAELYVIAAWSVMLGAYAS